MPFLTTEFDVSGFEKENNRVFGDQVTALFLRVLEDNYKSPFYMVKCEGTNSDDMSFCNNRIVIRGGLNRGVDIMVTLSKNFKELKLALFPTTKLKSVIVTACAIPLFIAGLIFGVWLSQVFGIWPALSGLVFAFGALPLGMLIGTLIHKGVVSKKSKQANREFTEQVRDLLEQTYKKYEQYRPSGSTVN